MHLLFSSTVSPNVLYVWSSGDMQLKPSAVLSMDPQRGTLSIQQTLDTHAGEYTCVAVNSAGSAQGYITLDVGCKAIFHTPHLNSKILWLNNRYSNHYWFTVSYTFDTFQCSRDCESFSWTRKWRVNQLRGKAKEMCTYTSQCKCYR